MSVSSLMTGLTRFQRSFFTKIYRDVYGAVLTILLLVFSSVGYSSEANWKLYDELLDSYVSTGMIDGIGLTLIDYEGLKGDQRFTHLTERLAVYPLDSLDETPEKLAFYINAYNIFALKMVVDHWPVASIRDIGNWFNPVWQKKAGVLGGKSVTLNQIEHDILRSLRDPRIHFAIVCASVSCPDLRKEAYRVNQLESQLDEQTGRFLGNPEKGIRVTGDRVLVSKIFDWFKEDFDQSGGVEEFITQYRSFDTSSSAAVEKAPISSNSGEKVAERIPSYRFDGYLSYDWRVNKK